jgi:hypothetical protein
MEEGEKTGRTDGLMNTSRTLQATQRKGVLIKGKKPPKQIQLLSIMKSIILPFMSY